MIQNSLVRIDFSLRREVFFVVIGAIIGAIAMVVPITFLYTGQTLKVKIRAQKKLDNIRCRWWWILRCRDCCRIKRFCT
jgi:hypothetical protein